MFLNLLSFEIRYWLKGFMVWVFLLIVGAMIFSAVSTDQVTIGQSLENTYRNAPYVIQTYYAFMGVLALLMTTAFVNSSASRDFAYNTHQIVFSTPLRKFDYLMARFFGAAIVSVIPLLGVSLGVILAKYMPWVDPERWRSIDWTAHLQALLVLGIPNTFFVAAIIFTVAVLTRSTVVSFIGALLLLVGYAVSEALTSDLDNERLAMLIDPFAIRTYMLVTKYWTVSDKNTLSVGLTGYLLLNRLLWMTVGGLVLAFGYNRFRFEERARGSKKTVAESETVTKVALPAVKLSFGTSAQWKQFVSHARVEFLSVVRSTSFIVLLVAALLNTVPNLILSANEGYGLSSLPVTYIMVDLIRGALYIFLVSMLTYYAGVLVWRERDAHFDEIQDALPYPNWISYAAKFLSLLGVLAIINLLLMISGIAVQASHQYTRFQLPLYLQDLFWWDFLSWIYLAALAFLLHVISPNKYLGYFAFIVALIANAFVWRPLGVASRMVRFGSMPGVTYSDFFFYKPALQAMNWYTVYWLLFSGLLGVLTVMLWPRGRETRLADRFRFLRWNMPSGLRAAGLLLGLTWVASAGWVYYNTKVLHTVRSENETDQLSADYEKTYKKYQSVPQPRIQSVKYNIDLDPPARALKLQGDQIIANKTSQPMGEMHISLSPDYEYEIQIERAALKSNDERLRYRIYTFNPPLAPGESVHMKYTVSYREKGFEDSLAIREIVQNGTFFNNTVTPMIGYQEGQELSERNDRKKYGLPEKDLMPALERNCTAHCMDAYTLPNSDWVMVETVISTVPSQIAVAPGSLLREWQENGRRYFHYKLDHPSLNFYSFISAEYEVAREDWNGVKLEVYYHKEHQWNVPKMLASMRKSLEYYTKNFGPYYHKQARIIEFPRVARFAQAFPGTMPYSEGIGFIANLKHQDDIDMVYYVTAHEMGHQWWAHQVIGARMQGATALSETLAQYSALMVMEKEYGRDLMRKFLEYEMDRYLRARGRELLKERPLLRVESSQGYIHYQKGSVVMYYLKELLGEDAVNRALRSLVEKYAYAEPPYPTSYVLYDALAKETPEQYKPLLKDLFEDITLFSNRTISATATKRPDGKYDVTLEVESKKLKADEKGLETEVPVADYIEIGAFAKPEKGRKYGKTLYRERILMKEPSKKLTFTVDQLPEKAGIDPFHLLVDRVPDDNVKKVSIGG